MAETMFALYFPYCLQRLQSGPDAGRYVLLNRRYQPLGQDTAASLRPDARQPTPLDIPQMTPALARLLSFDARDDLDAIYLYKSADTPRADEIHWESYSARLALLANLAAGPTGKK